MVDDQIPSFLEDEVRSRIASRGTESTFVVDESSEEVIVSYTGFTDALKREYRNTCEERSEEEIKVYHLTKGGWEIQLVRYDNANGMEGEVVWRR